MTNTYKLLCIAYIYIRRTWIWDCREIKWGFLGTSDGISLCSFASGTFQVLEISQKEVLAQRPPPHPPPPIGWCWWNSAPSVPDSDYRRLLEGREGSNTSTLVVFCVVRLERERVVGREKQREDERRDK